MPSTAGGLGIIFFIAIIYYILIFLLNLALFLSSIGIILFLLYVVEKLKLTDKKKLTIKIAGGFFAIILFILSINMFAESYNAFYLSPYNSFARLAGLPRFDYYPFGCENLDEMDNQSLRKCGGEKYCETLEPKPEMQFFKDDCFGDVAVEKKDPNICDKIAHSGRKYSCYSGAGVASNDSTWCDKIPFEEANANYNSAKYSCYENIALAAKDKSLCNKIQDIDYRAKCVEQIELASN